ncbi:Ubiquitin carboxyl-terminal hydrolase 25 [Elasticomyces elasticus]|nr:Ubiquitin carboxyl-terminal hydrolase 25 [Elasticomyces elasticus]KAK3645953.1 Ubiquitin carboxyl-terminal hydrolase 25 [Elasticomyces elasticus]KAK4914821.1 Ubiquitin carboxyl-terminal hydrolase 25 [Elasticomyces elasticus]KAK5754105.1 Ubiquitin carboxyl-terminal hydrolase 25 [Elasticomyces elasticus]
MDSQTSTSFDNLDNTKGSESEDGPDGLDYRVEDLVVMRFTQRTTCSVCDIQKDSDEYLKEEEISVTMTDEAKKYNGLDLLSCFGEHLRDEVQAECDGCVAKLRLPASVLGNSAKSQKRRIVQAPNLLVMQIMRAGTYNKKHKTMNKLTEEVPFDEELDLSAFTHDGTELRYRLYGVVAHRGPHASKGHYIAGVRDRGGKKFTRVDDDVIGRHYRGSFQEMRKPRTEKDGTFTPGVLVWQRIS